MRRILKVWANEKKSQKAFDAVQHVSITSAEEGTFDMLFRVGITVFQFIEAQHYGLVYIVRWKASVVGEKIFMPTFETLMGSVAFLIHRRGFYYRSIGRKEY